MMQILILLLLSVTAYHVKTAVMKQNSPGRPLRTEYATHVMKAGIVESDAISVKSKDFNSALEFDGHIGYPGLKIRVNANAFRYASFVITQILNQEIPEVRIPPFSQCLPEVNGCAQLSNIMITYYMCPQRVNLFPLPYNRIVLNIENFAISLSGQLGGQIILLLPIPLCGSLCIDARQISVSVQMSIERSPYSGAARLRVDKCAVNIGYLNIYIANGGLIGDLINSNFRGKLIAQARSMLPGKVCDNLPGLLDKKVNSYLAGLPQAIPIVQMLSYATAITTKPQKLPQYCYMEMCRRYRARNTSLSVNMLKVKTTFLAGIPNLNNSQQILDNNQTLPSNFNDTSLENAKLQPQANQRLATNYGMQKKFRVRSISVNGSRQGTKQVRMENASLVWHQCAGCENTEEEVVSHYVGVLMDRIRGRASDLVLSTYLLGAYATNMDLTLSLRGEFSPNAQGGTPFAAPILRYPTPNSVRMFDVLISDYTLNTLLYHLHRKGVFAFRIDPEVLSIGDLLNTTCAGDDFDFDLSAEIQTPRRNSLPRRKKRQDSIEVLRNFGVCFGDIAPEIREKHPGMRVYIMIKTARAPSMQFRAADGGTVVVEFLVDGLIFLVGTSIRVGRIRIAATFALIAHLVANRIAGTAKIEHLKFIDIDKTFGLPQDAFDNLADLARGTITKVVNNKLAQGIPLALPLGTPIELRSAYFQVVEHALLILTNVDISAFSLRSPNRYSR